MSPVTRLLQRINEGDQDAASQLWPLVYDELKLIAAHYFSHEKAGHTIQTTALVHEAYLRLVGEDEQTPSFNGRPHFFAAAAEAMRRVLIDHARSKNAAKRGGHLNRKTLEEVDAIFSCEPSTLLAIDDLISRLSESNDPAGEIAKLRVYGGLTVEEASVVVGVSRASAFRLWSYARAYLIAGLESTN